MDNTIEKECNKIIAKGKTSKLRSMYERAKILGEEHEMVSLIKKTAKHKLHDKLQMAELELFENSGCKVTLTNTILKKWNSLVVYVYVPETNIILRMNITNVTANLTRKGGEYTGESLYLRSLVEGILNNKSVDGNIVEILESELSVSDALGELTCDISICTNGGKEIRDLSLVEHRSIECRAQINTKCFTNMQILKEVIADLLLMSAGVINTYTWKVKRGSNGIEQDGEHGRYSIDWYSSVSDNLVSQEEDRIADTLRKLGESVRRR